MKKVRVVPWILGFNLSQGHYKGWKLVLDSLDIIYIAVNGLEIVTFHRKKGH